MKQVKKRKLGKTGKLIIIMSSLLIIFLAVYFIVAAVKKSEEENKKGTEYPDIIDGESIYIGKPIAYPKLEEKEILSLLVSNKNGTFDFTRWPDTNGSFWMGYDDGKGVNHMIQYIPPIVDAEGDFDYETLYAVENNDGFGKIYLLTYLCSAVGTPYFTERIPLPEGNSDEIVKERDLLYKEYGFDKAHVQSISFAYRNKEGKTENRRVIIGGRALSDSGYYYMVDERPYIYYTSNNYFDYALMGFNSFIKGMLVSAGLEEDSTYEPYLTTDFKEWVNTLHKEEGKRVEKDSVVVAKGESVESLNKGADYFPPDGAPTDGYKYSEYTDLTFDLELLKKHPDYERIKNVLVGQTVGVHYDKDSPSSNIEDKIFLTLINTLSDSPAKLLQFKDKTSLKYSYRITDIESLIDNRGEVFTKDTPVGEYGLVKVAYMYSIDGKSATNLLRHAVVDLNGRGIPDEAKQKIKASKIGALDKPIDFEIVYTLENSLSSVESMFVTDIVGIFDQSGREMSKIEKNSIISVRYYEVIDGEKSKEKSVVLNLATVEKDSKWERFNDVLIGKTKGENLNIKIFENTYHYEYLRDFFTYSISEISYYVTSELIASFKFCNASNRDPFYGESFFENTLENSYKLYGLNADACEEVVKFLGGIGDKDQESNHSVGLAGKTVAIGLNHKNMEKYGLYAYKIYFEIPRGLFDRTEGNEGDGEDILSDFGWYGTLGFNLYISKTDPATGKRYVGSDMYDLIAEVDAEPFDFLESSFADFWARKNLVLMNAVNLKEIDFDFNMKDIYGKYKFDINVKKIYVGMKDGKMTSSTQPFEGATPVDKFYVHASQSADAMETELSKYLEKIGKDEISISALYNEVLGNGKPMFVPGTVHTVGVSNFMEAFELLQLTRFEGILTEEEREAAFATEKIMSLRILVDGSSAYYYTYDFYRFDDRKVMVAIYQSDDEGNKKTTPVSDFYLSSFAFKKLVANFVGVLNAKELDNEIPFPNPFPEKAEK